jgi:sensor histidine kinase YesM
METNIYNKKQRWKFLLIISAVLIGVGSLAYTNRLVKDLSSQERKKVELWAEATKILISSFSPDNDLTFPLMVIENNVTVPIILTDSSGQIVTFRNLNPVKAKDEKFLSRKLEKMKESKEPIEIDLGSGDKNYIYYMDSILLTRLFYFPYVQLLVIMLFILVSYFAFSSSRKAEQNKVWVGLSKETAHQLGTPTSSLNAWIEILKEGRGGSDIIIELEKDAKRLEKIAQRFSKIGSKPVLLLTDLNKVISEVINYLKSRSSEKIIFEFNRESDPINIPLNEALFEWVIENILKNSMDAMDGKGKIKISVLDHDSFVHIDINDSGRGIPKARFKTIFNPGYTTKPRGWGLGLSLSKRIIESYHSGRIFVLHSDTENGTTMRIILKKHQKDPG